MRERGGPFHPGDRPGPGRRPEYASSVSDSLGSDEAERTYRCQPRSIRTERINNGYGTTHPLCQAVPRASWRPSGSWLSHTPSRRRPHPRPRAPQKGGSGRLGARPAHREYLCEIPVWRGQDDLLCALPGVWPQLLVAPLAGLPDLTTLGRRQIAALCGGGSHQPRLRDLEGHKNCLWRARKSPGCAPPGRVYIQQQSLNSDTSPAAQCFRQAHFLIRFPSHRSPITNT